jgi:hypothetical protein
MKFEHCEKIVSDTSDGRWLTTIKVTPYLRPSFAILSIDLRDESYCAPPDRGT